MSCQTYLSDTGCLSLKGFCQYSCEFDSEHCKILPIIKVNGQIYNKGISFFFLLRYLLQKFLLCHGHTYICIYIYVDVNSRKEAYYLRPGKTIYRRYKYLFYGGWNPWHIDQKANLLHHCTNRAISFVSTTFEFILQKIYISLNLDCSIEHDAVATPQITSSLRRLRCHSRITEPVCANSSFCGDDFLLIFFIKFY